MSSISSALTSTTSLANSPASATNSSSSSSTTGSSSSSGSSSTFMGTSSYSQDLQNVISRSVAIANFPIQQLTNQQTTLQAQSTELTTKIDTDLTNLQTAIQNIGQSMGASSYRADVSNTSPVNTPLVSATIGAGATEGNYSIEVDSIGSYATSLSASSWAGTSSSHGSYNLVINGTPNAITPTNNSAAGVAAAINSQYGSQVNATVVNVGSSSSPSYRISLQSTSLGSTTLNITDAGGNNLQTAQTVATLGSNAQYIINGSGLTVNSTSRSVTISTGLTVNLLASSVGNPVNITVSRPTSALSTALSSFADAYNTLVDELNNQRGSSTGPLQGQSIVSQLQNAMSKMGTYSSSSGSIYGLKALGLELDANYTLDGHLTFNQFTLDSADISGSSAVATFLGSSTTGGFLKAANDIVTNLTDPSSGLVPNAVLQLQSQITSLGDTISTKQAQVTQMQTNMQNRMAQMDALIATMQQQYSVYSGIFQAQQTSDQMYAHG